MRWMKTTKRLLAVALLLTLAASPAAAETAETSKILVACFSRAGENYGVGFVEKGNTEIVAEMIAEQVGAVVFSIQTVKPYPKGYEECTEIAWREKEEAARPELLEPLESLDEYEIVYLGYPIWYGDMPMAVYSFLENYDFTGKTILPFCTHAGSGLAGTVDSIRAVCEGATVLEGLAIAGTTAQNEPDRTRTFVNAWLNR